MNPVYRIENYIEDHGDKGERKLTVLHPVNGGAESKSIFLADIMIMTPNGPDRLMPPIKDATTVEEAFAKYQNTLDEVKAALNKIKNQQKLVIAKESPKFEQQPNNGLKLVQ